MPGTTTETPQLSPSHNLLETAIHALETASVGDLRYETEHCSAGFAVVQNGLHFSLQKSGYNFPLCEPNIGSEYKLRVTDIPTQRVIFTESRLTLFPDVNPSQWAQFERNLATRGPEALENIWEAQVAKVRAEVQASSDCLQGFFDSLRNPERTLEEISHEILRAPWVKEQLGPGRAKYSLPLKGVTIEIVSNFFPPSREGIVRTDLQENTAKIASLGIKFAAWYDFAAVQLPSALNTGAPAFQHSLPEFRTRELLSLAETRAVAVPSKDNWLKFNISLGAR